MYSLKQKISCTIECYGESGSDAASSHLRIRNLFLGNLLGLHQIGYFGSIRGCRFGTERRIGRL